MRLRAMSTQREQSSDSFLSEMHELRCKMESLLPNYLAGLHRLCQMPDEFECGFWASCLEALLEKVKADYQRYQAQAQEASLYGKIVTLAADTVLKVGGMEPIPLPDSLRLGVSISPSGKIEPALMDDPNRQPDAVAMTYEEFVAIAQRLRGEILKGTIVPKSEDEIPKLIYGLAAEQK